MLCCIGSLFNVCICVPTATFLFRPLSFFFFFFPIISNQICCRRVFEIDFFLSDAFSSFLTTTKCKSKNKAHCVFFTTLTPNVRKPQSRYIYTHDERNDSIDDGLLSLFISDQIIESSLIRYRLSSSLRQSN